MNTQLSLDLGIETTIDVRSLIVHGDIEREPRRAKRAQPEPSWERVLSDGADCAFRRRCGSRSQMLVLRYMWGYGRPRPCMDVLVKVFLNGKVPARSTQLPLPALVPLPTIPEPSTNTSVLRGVATD